MRKQLARVQELRQVHFMRVMDEINQIARKCGLREYNTYSRLWEYPWLWFQLEFLRAEHPTVLDVGTEESPFPWFLAAHGFNVIVSDVTDKYWAAWRHASKRLKLPVKKRVLDTQALNVATASLDIYLSVSVLEHVPRKSQAIREAARVLRPGGLLVMTFDICEPDLGMTFPEWNGRALTMAELDDLFRRSSWFEPAVDRLPWNPQDISEYLAWHRTTAPHHNYVTGAAIVRRNQVPWVEPVWRDPLRLLRNYCQTGFTALRFPLRHRAAAIRRAFATPLGALSRRAISAASSPRTATTLGEPLFRMLGLRRAREEMHLSRVGAALVVRLDEIGDVVMTTPFLRELRRNMSAAWITLVVKPELYNLVELCPYVNEVLTYDSRTHDRPHTLRRHGRALRLAWQHLWRRRFELAILPRWDADRYGAFVLYFSGAPWRVGYSEKVTEEKSRTNAGCNRLFSHLLDDTRPKHEVEHNLDVIRFVGGTVQDERLEMWLEERDGVFAEDTWKSHGVRPNDLLIAFGPGAGAPKRMWPLSGFLDLGDCLRRELQSRIVVLGGQGDKPLGEELERHLGKTVINLAGRTTLRQSEALLKRCQLLVGNDSGPMHLAAAAGVPVVEISCHPRDGSPSHYNSPTRFGPWGVPNRILQPMTALDPCAGACTAPRAHCITSVSFEQAKEAVVAELSREGTSRLPQPLLDLGS